MTNANHELDQLLKAAAQQSPPTLPARFQQDVWRRIRSERDANSQPVIGSLANWLFNMMLRPQAVAAALSVALLFGTVAGFGLAANTQAKPSPAVQLDAFSVNSPSMSLMTIK